MFGSNRDILTVLGAISMKLACIAGKPCSNIFQRIFKFESLVIKKIQKQKCRRRCIFIVERPKRLPRIILLLAQVRRSHKLLLRKIILGLLDNAHCGTLPSRREF